MCEIKSKLEYKYHDRFDFGEIEKDISWTISHLAVGCRCLMIMNLHKNGGKRWNLTVPDLLLSGLVPSPHAGLCTTPSIVPDTHLGGSRAIGISHLQIYGVRITYGMFYCLIWSL